MKHRIDPTIDCVFKAILGAEANKNLLLHFLQNILKSEPPIAEIEILNPYNEKEFETDKLTIVDLKAREQEGKLYQIEIQLAVHMFLPERILYTWSDLYQSQLGEGDNFNQLQPVISIWLLTHTFFKESLAYHHHFQLYDPQHPQLLSQHLAIHVLELSKWKPHDPKFQVLDEEELWYYFFRDGKEWDTLPPIADTPEMRQAMSVLKQFSERERDYHQYQARQNYLREQWALQETVEQAQKEKQEALAEKDRLLALLKEAGIDPDQKPS